MKLVELGLKDKVKFTKDVNLLRLCTYGKTDEAKPNVIRKPAVSCYFLRKQDDPNNSEKKILEKYFSAVILDKYPGSSIEQKLIRAIQFIKKYYPKKLNFGGEGVISYFNTSILKPEFNNLTYEYNPSGEFQTHSGIFPAIDDEEHKQIFNAEVAPLIYKKVIEDKSYISVKYLLDNFKHLYDEEDPLELD